MVSGPTSMDSDHDVTLALAVVAANDTTTWTQLKDRGIVGRHGQNHGFLGVLNKVYEMLLKELECEDNGRG